ncbi:MAG TPA: nucleoid-associated protein [Acetivibrio sp.]|nr:nucleoid-associated protein [Clostridium sp.]HOQ36357.1 nucleoid-associated protein [Acetivibrio sp.]HPT91039.1 nucleoid-associated protein [Acetivibrio sp.]HQA57213.1 nucleoid-associated protein [Acetivibrio sp.]
MDKNIKIEKAVLHILDNNVGIPVYSDKELDLDSDINDFLGKHIDKLFSDTNLKQARFIGDNNSMRDLCQHLANNNGDFLRASIFTAQRLFDIMTKNVDIAPADLICCLFRYNGQSYFGILKLNYKTGFTHYVQNDEEGNVNTIIRHRTLLPSDSQKIDECAFINLDSLETKLIEKAYEINGEKEFYLSKLFLICSTNLSDNEKLKILDKVTQKINKKFFDEDFNNIAKLKKAVSETLEETSCIEVDSIADEVFENNLEIKNEYIAEIKRAGLNEKTISIPEKLAERRFRTSKIKTDTGIEINFPSSYYNDKNKLEFINNPDGTVSILIKNINKITNK